MSPSPALLRRFRRIVLLLLAAAGAFAGWTGTAVLAAPAQTAGLSVDDKIAAFFNTVIQGDTAKAFDTLLDGSTISANKPEAASVFKQQLAADLRRYGKPLDFEEVDRKVFGASLTRCVYILKLEKHPLTFEFFFYQSGRTCLPIDVRFNDRLEVYRYDRVPATASDALIQP